MTTPNSRARAQHSQLPLRRSRPVLLAGLLAASAIAAPQAGGAAVSAHPASNPVLAWNEIASRAALVCLAPTNNPLHESRMYAMLHAAIHDALNSIERRAQPYAFDATSPADASVDAAVAAAAREVLVPTLLAIPAPFPVECGQAAAAIVEAEYDTVVGAILESDAKAAGLAAGQGAAAAILAKRDDDGSDTPLLVFDMPQGTQPGEYRHTPGTPLQFAPGWADVTPFVLRSSDQFRASKPDKVTSKKYAADYNEVKALGGDGVEPNARTAEQTEIALFWVESSPLQWNRIARTVAADADLDVWASARLFGLLNFAMADGYISSFESKNHYNFWRPVTAIHEGDSDGNPLTEGDATWTPLVATPPIPDHDSAHAVEGAAASRVMQLFFGTDAIAFETCSLTLPDDTEKCGGADEVLRSFDSFSQAAAENGDSRVLVGFHFRNAVNEGLEHGRNIANRTFHRVIRTVP